MDKKVINVEIEVDEKVAFFIENIAHLKQISLSEAYKQIIDAGINKGAKNLNDAIYKGLLQHKEEIDKICQYIKLQEIVSAPPKPANEVEKILAHNVEMLRDDKLIDEITKSVTKGKK